MTGWRISPVGETASEHDKTVLGIFASCVSFLAFAIEAVFSFRPLNFIENREAQRADQNFDRLKNDPSGLRSLTPKRGTLLGLIVPACIGPLFWPLRSKTILGI